MTPPNNNGGAIPISGTDSVNPKVAEHSNINTLNLKNNVFTPTPADNSPDGVEPSNKDRKANALLGNHKSLINPPTTINTYNVPNLDVHDNDESDNEHENDVLENELSTPYPSSHSSQQDLLADPASQTETQTTFSTTHSSNSSHSSHSSHSSIPPFKNSLPIQSFRHSGSKQTKG